MCLVRVEKNSLQTLTCGELDQQGVAGAGHRHLGPQLPAHRRRAPHPQLVPARRAALQPIRAEPGGRGPITAHLGLLARLARLLAQLQVQQPHRDPLVGRHPHLTNQRGLLKHVTRGGVLIGPHLPAAGQAGLVVLGVGGGHEVGGRGGPAHHRYLQQSAVNKNISIQIISHIQKQGMRSGPM